MRFQYLKAIRVQIETQKDIKRLIRYVMCGCILHNLLIEEPIPPDWEPDIHDNGLDEDDALNSTLPIDAAGGERRNQLLCYMLEVRA